MGASKVISGENGWWRFNRLGAALVTSTSNTASTAREVFARVVKYCRNQRAGAKELDALDDALFIRIDRKVLALAENPRSTVCKKLKGYKRH